MLKKKLISKLMVLALLSSVFAAEKPRKSASLDDFLRDKNTKNTKLVIGFDSFPPLGFIEPDGNIAGYDIDLAKEVCKRLGYKFEAKPIDWDLKEKELNSKKIDCIWNGMSITEYRKDAMSMTEPYLNNEQVLVVRADSNIKTLADAAGKVIGVQKYSMADDAINDNEEFADSLAYVIPYEDNLNALYALSWGDLDGVVMDSILAHHEIATGKMKFVIADGTLSSEYYGIAFRKDAEGEKLRDDVWKTLNEMAADGTIARISTKWFGTDISVIGK